MSDMNLIETHFNIQRRLFDYQFALTQTPMEFEQTHQEFIQIYNSTAHYGLLKEKFGVCPTFYTWRFLPGCTTHDANRAW
jgi:hypothetical protein